MAGDGIGMADDGSPLKVLWFAPSAGNWITHRMEHRVANALARAGHFVTMIQCDGVLDAYCPVMAAGAVTAMSPVSDRRAVCRECRYAAHLTRDRARYATRQLSEFVSRSAREQVDELMAQVDEQSWAGITFEGIPVGRHAAYTAMLHHKRPTVSDAPESWAEYRADLRGALLAAHAAAGMADELAPERAVVYNALYPANRAFAEVMLGRSVPIINLAGGPSVPRRYATVSMFDGVRASQTTVDSAAFASGRRHPCSEQEVRHVERHIAQLISGTDPWVYSAAPSGRTAAAIRTSLRVRPHSAVVTVLVNSPDETRSALLVDAEYFRDPVNGYSDVNEFLEEAIAVASRHPQVDFVVRLHPRLAPNKRESVTSPDLERLYGLLADTPDNVIVNHPSDGISIYELVAISDAAVNQSSSAGLEFLAFGLPVVQYDAARLGAYPPEFAVTVPRRSPADFDLAVESALDTGFSLDHAVDAYRWFATLHVRSVVDLDPLEEITRPADADVARAETSVAPERGPRAITRFIPSGVRARIDRRVVRGQWEADEIDIDLPAGSLERIEQALRRATVEGDVWEPVLRLPDQSSIEDERALVQESMQRLLARLPVADSVGVGALTTASHPGTTGSR